MLELEDALHPLVRTYLENCMRISEQWKKGMLTEDEYAYSQLQILVDYQRDAIAVDSEGHLYYT